MVYVARVWRGAAGRGGDEADARVAFLPCVCIEEPPPRD